MSDIDPEEAEETAPLGDQLITDFAANHAQALSTIPEEHWRDTLALAALLCGPMVLALAYGFPVEPSEVRTVKFSSLIAEPLGGLIDGLEHIHVSARALQLGGELAHLSPRCCGIFVPRSKIGLAMIDAALAIASIEANEMYGSDRDTEAEEDASG